MNYVIFYNIEGEITNIACSNGDPTFELKGHQILAIDQETAQKLDEARGGYVVDGIVHFRPRCPGPFFEWDSKTKTWALNELIKQATLSEEARAERNRLLVDSDWTDTLSAKQRLGNAIYDAWQTYRQALRDISEQVGFPLNIDWPQPPV